MDFYCASHRLVIELDGRWHSLKDQYEKDQRRDANLTEMGFIILRFTNAEINTQLNEVQRKILKFANEKVTDKRYVILDGKQ